MNNELTEIIRRQKVSKAVISPQEFEAMVATPEYYDEETIGGSMPNLEADDDVLQTQQEFGFYLEVDTPQAEEMDLQKGLDKAETTRRRRRD